MGAVQPYSEFLDSKRVQVPSVGFEVPPRAINPALYNFQRDIVRWACRRGRAAIFADCGLGKTPMQLEWARLVDGEVLILAPLAVAQQTVREGNRFGIYVTYARSQEQIASQITITNYEMLERFDLSRFKGLVLDESSILKAYEGKTRKLITEGAQVVPFRLACTATPAPNDLIEIINHAEYLGVMRGKEIIALYFTQDGNTTHAWRLKGHAKADFWRWLATWSVALRKPSDLGFEDAAFILPELAIQQHSVKATAAKDALFAMDASTLQERQAARRQSTPDRVALCAKLVNETPGPWVVWCNLNSESEALAKAISGSVEVQGKDSPDEKSSAALGFAEGKYRVVISKPSIFGFGLNWQHCANVAFVGLSDSYEEFYQAVRRCWRFGQKQPVKVHVITASNEGRVVANIQRKEIQSSELMDQLVKHVAVHALGKAEREEMQYVERVERGARWTLHLGDCVKVMDRLADDSVGLSVFSPPFPGMYAYTNSRHDIGNTRTIDEMVEHFSYVVAKEKLWRITMPGRLACIHLCQLTAMKSREGWIGLHDYRGRVIRMMIDAGWVYAGEATIDKNPQVQATRNKERGLLFKSLATDSSVMRMALADYLVYFRKPGDNAEPIHAGISEKYNAGGGWITEEEWIEWASPVWYRQVHGKPGGIRETDVLNVKQARETDDERHLCPLQLGVIERAVKLWSAPGDLVFSPFAGIGSEGYISLKYDRHFVGIELKDSYFREACRHLREAEAAAKAGDLFGGGRLVKAKRRA